ncbi:MlaD family protein [Nocardia wallacei]|uniref:MlaD family protein n=1 Tax=Nocardia wallacei TaxID=480035 RepID=UPI002455F033|nr:MlaD family protein [Nocardia wallacei]
MTRRESLPAIGFRVLDRSAGAVVAGIDALFRRRLTVSWVALVLTLVLGAGYLTFGALRTNPFRSSYQVRIHLAQSGGLLPNQDVTIRGQRVGRVSSVDIERGRVVVDAAIDSSAEIPADTTVRVASLSAAGEQYLDFVPAAGGGPFLADGSVVESDRTSTPVTLAQLLGDANGAIVQLDPAKLATISRELGAGSQAPEKLAAIIDGGTFLISTLGAVLPQTVSLLRHSEIVLSTVRDTGPGLTATVAEMNRVASGVESMTDGYATLLGTGPRALQTMDRVIADNSPTMVQLLGNLATVAQMSYAHVPAFQEFFFPQQRDGSAVDAIGKAFHDNAVWALVNIYPRKQCDYDLPRRAATDASFPEPYLYAYCTDPDPSMVVRGARNAPRPPGDDTAGPPPGVDPLATAAATPQQPRTVPTPYGGIPQPAYVPPR